VLAALERIAVRRVARRGAGSLVLQPGEERRRTSSHYTPRSLSEPIVKRTLEPLIVAMSETGEPTSAQLLSLKVCDPAMGSGAFLVAACRYLADHVVAAWEREGATDKIASAREDVVNHARRLVAQTCLYGVDRNPFAVSLAKLSLWLETLAKDEPFTFVDHALRWGDSLVGLSFAQLQAFHWAPTKQVEFIEPWLTACVGEALGLREEILRMAGDASPGVQRLKEQLLWDANDAQERLRVVGDLVVGAFFECGKKEREGERRRRMDAVQAWLEEGGELPAELARRGRGFGARIPVFHWGLEFPEVFHRGRKDPLGGSGGAGGREGGGVDGHVRRESAVRREERHHGGRWAGVSGLAEDRARGRARQRGPERALLPAGRLAAGEARDDRVDRDEHNRPGRHQGVGAAADAREGLCHLRRDAVDAVAGGGRGRGERGAHGEGDAWR
jgi:hypothetical protein